MQMGLVSKVVPQEELLQQAQAYAAMLATTVSPRSMRVIKKQVYEALSGGLGEAIEAANGEMIASLQCEDFKEGVAHFVERRLPQFTGN